MNRTDESLFIRKVVGPDIHGMNKGIRQIQI